jgi:hypothetical protein
MRCLNTPYEDIKNIIEYGCDLVIMNGQQLGTL